MAGTYIRLTGHETSTHICLKMEHLIYMFKALSIQAAAKVNISAALVFPKRFSRTLNILTKLSNQPASGVAASDLIAKCVYSGSDGPFRLLLLCKYQCHFSEANIKICQLKYI